jgi:hypothetical protein
VRNGEGLEIRPSGLHFGQQTPDATGFNEVPSVLYSFMNNAGGEVVGDWVIA